MIPESIFPADVFSKILSGISQYLLKENVYSLLYGSSVNPYYNINIGRGFIINNVLYMTLYLPLKHHRAPIVFLYGLYSYYIPTNMSDSKTTTSAYTRLEIRHPYLLSSVDQFALLDDNMDRNMIQYDHMYVQTTPILLFRWTNKSSYINIIEHTAANVMTSRCEFLYYHKITVHTTLVTTNNFFYLFNIKNEIKINCGKYNCETVCETHSVSIIKWKDVCDCVIQTTEIQLIGTYSNSISNGNFIIYHTFNFVTEWLYNKLTLRYYR